MGFRAREVVQRLRSDIPHLFHLSRGPDLNSQLVFRSEIIYFHVFKTPLILIFLKDSYFCEIGGFRKSGKWKSPLLANFGTILGRFSSKFQYEWISVAHKTVVWRPSYAKNRSKIVSWGSLAEGEN